MIFTPHVCFAHDRVAQVRVMPGIPKEATCGNIRARLAVDMRLHGDVHLFYGDEAADVLAQLADAGVLTPAQADAMRGRLRDEEALATASGIDA
jgi:hypothetical protein